MKAVIGEATTGGGVEHGPVLVAFVEAALTPDLAPKRDRLDATRASLRDAVGDAGLVDAAGVMAAFDATDRIVDAVGLPLSETLVQRTAEIRAELGLDAMRGIE